MLPVYYKNKKLEQKLLVDLLIKDLLIVELKAIESILPLFQAQLLTCMKLSNKPKGLLINFNCKNIASKGLISLVNSQFSELPKKLLNNSSFINDYLNKIFQS